MEKVSRLKQAMYEASVREVNKNLLEYVYNSFLIYLKEFRLARYPIGVVFFTYVYMVFPELKAKLLSDEMWSNLPFAFDPNSIVDITDGNTKLVFRFTLSDGKLYVIKINKNSIGINTRDLLDSGLFDLYDFNEVKRWYSGLDIVHHTSFVAVNTAFDNKPAIASIQEFLNGNLTDIFDYMQDVDTLFKILKSNPEFASQIYLFSKRTLEIYGSQRRCLDVLGRRNIVILHDENQGPRLKILDTDGLIYFEQNGRFEGPDIEKVLSRIDFFRDIVSYYERNLKENVYLES